MNDLAFTCRTLWRKPGLVLISVITLALGIGANTAIFTVINGVLLRPLIYPKPQELLTLKSNQSAPELRDLRDQSQSFARMGGVGALAADYTGGAEPIHVNLGLVAGDFFATLDVPALLGRTLNAADDQPGSARLTVLSHSFWKRHLAGNPTVIGREITLAGQSYNIAGVMPDHFRAPDATLDAFVPIHVFYPAAARSRGAHLVRGYARLLPGKTLAQAQSELRIVDDRIARAYPDERKRENEWLPLQEKMVGNVRPALLILFGAVALLLVVACANFANLLLVRIHQRSAELSIRAALGASRWRLLRQVLLESTLLSLLGGAAGLILGSWGIDALLALKPTELPRVENIHLDSRVLLFTFALSLLTGLIFGLLPAWSATRRKAAAIVLGAGHKNFTAPFPLRGVLVVVELALSLILLIGAGLLGRTFWRLTTIAPGFDPGSVVTMRVELPEARYKTVPPQTRFRDQVLENINRNDGWKAAMISELPLGGDAIDHPFIVEGRPSSPSGKEPELYSRSIAGDYLDVLRIPLLQGRSLNRDDRADTPRVGVVNQAAVRRFFPGENPIGRRVRWALNGTVDWITIVGVVGDVRHFGLAQTEEPAIYTPYAQSDEAWKRWSEIVVRTAAPMNEQATGALLKQAVWKVDPLLALNPVRSMNDVLAVSLAERKFNLLLLGVFAATAVVLAGVGLYGVLASIVAQRIREIGIRLAVGAQRRDILVLVLGRALVLALVGVALGLIGAGAGTRVLGTFLYQITPTDPVTFAVLALFVILVAFLATIFPARRAMEVDPVVALRHE